jgi:hypothetical protein
MAKPNKLQVGDTVAYAAKFLRDTCQHTGNAPKRRGTFVSYWAMDERYARVKWYDFDFDYQAHQNGLDYAEDAREHGQLVMACNIAKVGSPRFALNDM